MDDYHSPNPLSSFGLAGSYIEYHETNRKHNLGLV